MVWGDSLWPVNRFCLDKVASDNQTLGKDSGMFQMNHYTEDFLLDLDLIFFAAARDSMGRVERNEASLIFAKFDNFQKAMYFCHNVVQSVN